MLRNDQELIANLSEFESNVLPTLERLEEVATFIKNLRNIHNLYANKNVDNLWTKLAAESLQALRFIPKEGVLFDVGSGNGIPALVYALFRPDLSIVLTESIQKKAQVLELICNEFQLKQVSVFAGRAEQHHGSPSTDVISARAVAPLPVLWQWVRPRCKVGTRFVLFRGSSERKAQPTPRALTCTDILELTPNGLAIWVATVTQR